jgi:hypothetical protein
MYKRTKEQEAITALQRELVTMEHRMISHGFLFATADMLDKLEDLALAGEIGEADKKRGHDSFCTIQSSARSVIRAADYTFTKLAEDEHGETATKAVAAFRENFTAAMDGITRAVESAPAPVKDEATLLAHEAVTRMSEEFMAITGEDAPEFPVPLPEGVTRLPVREEAPPKRVIEGIIAKLG